MHELEHRDIAPVMIVIAHSSIVLWISAIDGNDDLRLPLWHRRQPGKVVLFMLAKEETAGFGPPGGCDAREGDIHHHSLSIDMNGVGMQVPFEGVRTHGDIAGLFGSREVF